MSIAPTKSKGLWERIFTNVCDVDSLISPAHLEELALAPEKAHEIFAEEIKEFLKNSKYFKALATLSAVGTFIVPILPLLIGISGHRYFSARANELQETVQEKIKNHPIFSSIVSRSLNDESLFSELEYQASYSIRKLDTKETSPDDLPPPSKTRRNRR